MTQVRHTFCPLTTSLLFFSSFTLDTSGIHLTVATSTNFAAWDKTGAQVVSDGTLLYTNGGYVWEPATQKLAGTFAVNPGDVTSYVNWFNLALEPSARRLYAVGATGLSGLIGFGSADAGCQ